jgi:hypothetical protein
MTEAEFVKRVNAMAMNVYMNGGEAEVLIIPMNTEIDEPRGMMEAVSKGGVKVEKVETAYGTIDVVSDPYCPADKWYMVDWLTVERMYKKVQREYPFFPLRQIEKTIVERL